MSAQEVVDFPSHSHHFSYDLDLTTLLEVLFYVVLLLKMIHLSFCFNRRLTVRERVIRKQRWAYCDYMKQLSEEDKRLMHATINNTIINATLKEQHARREPKHSKRVKFDTSNNLYYPPADMEQYQIVQSQMAQESEEEGASLVSKNEGSLSQLETNVDVATVDLEDSHSEEPVSLSGRGLLREGDDRLLCD